MKKVLVVLALVLIHQVVVLANDKNGKKTSVNKNESSAIVIKGSLNELVNGAKVALPFANVYIDGTTDLTITNIEGNFELNANKRVCKVKCTYKGYETYEQEIDLQNGINVKLDIVMKRKNVHSLKVAKNN